MSTPVVGIVSRLRQLPKFIGRRAITWLGVGISASLALAGVEYAITIFLQAFLSSLGLIQTKSGMMGPLAEWHPTHAELGAFLLMIGIVRSFGLFLVLQSGVVTNEAINARLRLAVLHQMLQSRSQKFISAAEISLRISEIFPKASRFCEACSYFVANSILCAAMGVMMLIYAWKEATIGLIGLGLVGILVLKTNRKVAAAAASIPVEQQKLLSGISRVARNWLLVKVLRTGPREYQSLANNTLRYTASSFRAGFFTYFGSVLPPLLGIFLLVIILSLHFKFWDTGGMAFLSFLYIFIRFSQYVGTLAVYFGSAVATYPQFKAAADFFLSLPDDEARTAVVPLASVSIRGRHLPNRALATSEPTLLSGPLTPQTPPAILIERLRFSYEKSDVTVIQDLSLQVKPGEQFAIVGKSGSGKSTLLGLILGILPPSRGSIAIDGAKPETYFARPHIRIGYVGAEAFLLDGSIRDNLIYGLAHQVSDAMCWDALRRASLLEVVQEHKEGLDYRITENGEGLSAGQKQRLALARALLAEPPVLVLDEVSANLDDVTEAEIAESIKNLKGHSTVIIVSHRPGILKYADNILKMGAQA